LVVTFSEVQKCEDSSVRSVARIKPDIPEVVKAQVLSKPFAFTVAFLVLVKY